MEPELFPVEPAKSICIKYAYARKKNKRIDMAVIKKADGEVVVLIETKALIGSWKDRNIREATVIYGIETMTVLNDLFSALFMDREFLKIAYHQIAQLSKDKFELATNLIGFDSRTGYKL